MTVGGLEGGGQTCLCEYQSVMKQTSAYRQAPTTVHFPLAPAWETNCYSKTPNRQLSVVSVHKKSRDLCESGNKAVKRQPARRKRHLLIQDSQRVHI